MRMISLTLALLSVIPQVLGCADHENHLAPQHVKRQLNNTRGPRVPTFWQYEASYNWGRLSPDYELCQTGTQQSPIGLSRNQGISEAHIPLFSGYQNVNASGEYYNWGYGPAFTFYHPDGDYSGLPSMNLDGETLYLRGWHIHAPADHVVDGFRHKAELHYVHYTANGSARAVVGIRLAPGREDSSWFANLPSPAIHFNDTSAYENIQIDPLAPINEVRGFNEFWTYRGSLTSPPCDEGLQWFLARSILYTSRAQMQEILRVSTFSARAEQDVWDHQINV